MRQLLVLISWCMLSVSCIAGQNALNVESQPLQLHKTPIFKTGTTEAVFRGSMNVYKHYFSGIFALKKETEENYRIVLMSEVGITLFDLSFTSKDFKINYCIKPLQKKKFLKLLYHDFLLLVDAPNPENLKLRKNRNTHIQFVLYKKKNSRDFYYIEKKTIVKIVSKAFLNKTNIQFQEIKEGVAQSIHIQHRPVKLKMELKRIK